jgi:4-oxalomesaconate tautomerase
MQKAIPYMQIRGGSSKGLYFNAAALPQNTEEKDRILIAAMCGRGPTDIRQIDGLGGADPLTSKVGIVSLSKRDDADLEYEFVQVVLGEGKTDRTQNCGNILAGIVPFALETGMLPSQDPITEYRVFMINSESLCKVRVSTPNGKITYAGDASIDGVPGTSAPISCLYEGITGAICGALLPTGNKIDVIDDIPVTCLDNGMPVVLIRAEDLGRSGYESPNELSDDLELKQRLESIRLKAGHMMNLGDVREKVVPKMTLIAPPRAEGIVSTRSFIPHRVHAAVGVLAAVTVATGCLVPGTVAQKVAVLPEHYTGDSYLVEHPSGSIGVSLELEAGTDIPIVKSAGVIRTARALSRGELLLPEEENV